MENSIFIDSRFMKSDWLIGYLMTPNGNNALVLMIYGVLLIGVIFISVRYRRSAMQKLERPQRVEPDLGLNEWAFLSGGAQRLMQLATFRLYEKKILTYDSHWLRQKFVPVETLPFPSESFTKLEQLLYSASSGKGKLVGMEDLKFRESASPVIEHIEAKLAMAGLRPKETERQSIMFHTLLPYLLLIVLGALRVFYGLSQDYTVFYLVILLCLTLVIGICVTAFTPKLTKTGIELLHRKNTEFQSALASARTKSYRMELASTAVALSGAVGLVAFPDYLSIQDPLQRMSAGGNADASAAGGCGSSGCGTSGCGSSGCGGGCGGD
jgi:uncharacterized protein (TIGR04222 family)